MKLEIDTRPPAGARLATTIVRRFAVLQLQHHDQGSLLAGKLHAILQRRYTKGRDLFDLIWYLSDPDWPKPNLAMLNNALQQTEWKGPILMENNWRGIICQRLNDVNWDTIVQDVQPFLEPGFDIGWLSRENIERVLRDPQDRFR